MTTTNELTEKQWRNAARWRHGGDELNVDDDAVISHAETGEGAWVQAWVWVPIEDAREHGGPRG